MGENLSDILVVLHLLWATFMIAGVALAIVGIFRPGWRRLMKLRTIHLAGIVFTASVPLWGGICPLTRWEDVLRVGAGITAPRSFLADLAYRLLYINVPIWVITLATTSAAVTTVVLYVMYPPWRSAGNHKAIS
jgi:hypothetical protein